MKYSAKIEKAIKVASLAHDGQYRKSYIALKVPYVSHLYSVAAIISNYTDDEDVISAGLLHDILEDTDYKSTDLLKEFGPRVHGFVDSVTEATKEEKKQTSWKNEKLNYLQKLKNASDEAHVIASADKIHNLLSSIESKVRQTRNPEEYIWFHLEAFALIKNRLGNHPVVKFHEDTLREAGKVFNQK